MTLAKPNRKEREMRNYPQCQDQKESSMRKIVSELLKESKCEKCNTKHKHILLDHAIDLSLEKIKISRFVIREKIETSLQHNKCGIFSIRRMVFSMFLAMLPYY